MARKALPLHDVDHLMRLLKWGREQGIRIGPMVTIGEVSVQVTDVRQAKLEKFSKGEVEDIEVDILRASGGGDEPAEGTSG